MKDYYTILGVSRDASLEEIKRAYRQRIKIIHPDRFDPKTQPNEWKTACEMLSELNGAYEYIVKEHKGDKTDYFFRDGGATEKNNKDDGSSDYSKQEDNVDKKEKEIEGINGWLLFFFIAVIISPILNLYDFFNIIENEKLELMKNKFLLIFLTLVILPHLLRYYGIYGMLKERSYIFVKRMRYILWISVISGIIFIEVISVLTYKFSIAQEKMLNNWLIAYLCSTVLWSSYLKKSKRVRNTYNKNYEPSSNYKSVIITYFFFFFVFLISFYSEAQKIASTVKNNSIKATNSNNANKFRSVSDEYFYSMLSSKVPDWEIINIDSNFIQWLQKRDPISGKTFHGLLLENFNNRDVEGVSFFFNIYKNEIETQKIAQFNINRDIKEELNNNLAKNVSVSNKQGVTPKQYDVFGVPYGANQNNLMIHNIKSVDPEQYEFLYVPHSVQQNNLINKYKEDKNYVKNNNLNKESNYVSFYEKLSYYVPDWREINRDPNFIEWVKGYEDGSTKSRRETIIEAYNNYDVETVVRFFLYYKKIYRKEVSDYQNENN